MDSILKFLNENSPAIVAGARALTFLSGLAVRWRRKRNGKPLSRAPGTRQSITQTGDHNIAVNAARPDAEATVETRDSNHV